MSELEVLPISINEIVSALSIAQGKFKQPTLNRKAEIKKNGLILYVTEYADLNECIECIREPLSSNGLCFTQTITEGLHGWVLTLNLYHKSGQSLKSTMPLSMSGSNQEIGGQLTYLKRYQLSAFFGLAADFDDDGNSGDNNGNQVTPVSKPLPKPPVKPSGLKLPKPNPITSPLPLVAPSQPDPANFTMPFGNNIKGLALRDITEAGLKEVYLWCTNQLEVVPPPKNISEIFDTKINIKLFLESMGVTIG